MKKNTITNNKMSAYSLMAISFLSVADVSGQLIYTDVDPDQTFDADGQSYDLDLNGDATIDFNIKVVDYGISSFLSTSSGSVFSGVVRGVLITPYNGNALAGYGNTSFANPYAYNYGDIIGSSLPFKVAPFQSLVNYQLVYDYPASGSNYVYASYGYWGGATDKYLAIQFNFGGDIYYGYARLDVSDNHHQFTIKDYAYNSTPEESIEIGFVSVSDKHLEQVINTYSYQDNIFVAIKDEKYLGSIATVFDLNGRVIQSQTLSNEENVISMAQFPTASYIVQIITEEGDVLSKQLISGQ